MKRNKLHIIVAVPANCAHLKPALRTALRKSLSHAQVRFERIERGKCRVIGMVVPQSKTSINGPALWTGAQQIVAKTCRTNPAA
jgi:hypothetical protein